jgi:hypothetical protein
VAVSHRQAYFNSPEPRAASPSLGSAALGALGGLYTGEDGLRVDAVEGLGMVAARTVDGFAHMVVGPFDGLLGIERWGAPHWRAAGDEPEELTALESAPPELEPAGGLLDAVLTGDPVVFVEPDERRRAALIAFVCFALPRAEAERLTFTTFTSHPTDVRLAATTPEHAGAFDLVIDASTPATSRYSLIALELARRGTLTDATRALHEPDALALAIAGGATDLITPDELSKTLELITAVAAAGDIATAARAAAAIPGGGLPGVAEMDEPTATTSSSRDDDEADEAPVSLRDLEASLEAPSGEWVTLHELEESLRKSEDEGL